MFWFLLPVFLLGSCLHNTLWPLYCHWREARRLNLPILVTPICRGGLSQRVLQVVLDRGLVASFIARLPCIRVSQGSWTFREKFSLHQEYGTVFILVSPTGCEIYVADAKAAKQILDRRLEFPKPNRLMGKMEAFGKNLATVDGEEWQRHRRLTSKAFHEKTYRAVWDETYSTASAIFRDWSTSDSVESTQVDMATLSLKVLVRACFSVDRQKERTAADSTNIICLQKHISRYLESLTTPLSAIQKHEVETDYRTLNDFIRKLIQNRKPTASRQSENDLLSSMLAPAGKIQFLDSEIAGNLFLFIFAGHETSASALVYIIHLLAIHPEWQEWAIEEVDHAFDSQTDGRPAFEAVYPQLKRLCALLYETLRLYGPVPMIVRKTAGKDQVLTDSKDSMIKVPRNMPININCMALHTDPDSWGADSLDWNPTRWLSPASGSVSEQGLFTKYSNVFFGWGAGPRICPGQKFSQIEVVAALLCLLRDYRVTIVPEHNEEAVESRYRIQKILQQSRVRLTLQMQEASAVRLMRRSDSLKTY
ncbi:cytochrome P450 monooxygenase [Aspergillus heterothallicus]